MSALVIGSSLLQKHSDAILSAIWSHDEDESKTDPAVNGALKLAMIKAVRDSVPQPHIKRILDLANQGWKSLTFEQMDTIGKEKGTELYLVKIQTILYVFRTHLWMLFVMMVTGIFTTGLN